MILNEEGTALVIELIRLDKEQKEALSKYLKLKTEYEIASHRFHEIMNEAIKAQETTKS